MSQKSVFSVSSVAQTAIDRVSIADTPDWVRPHDYSRDVTRTESEPFTELLIDIQEDAESNAHYIRNIRRLENQEAVQQLAQWQVDFAPNSQHIQLHSLHVHRADTQHNHLIPENFSILQREESLESFILHGHVTLLVLLENIRPGDLLEYSYTCINHPSILPTHFSSLKQFKGPVQTARFEYAVRFPSNNSMKWRASSSDNAPSEESDASHTRWSWSKTDLAKQVMEPNTPAWIQAEPWVQISNIGDWAEIGANVFSVWPFPDPSPLIEAKIDEIQKLDGPLEAKAEAALRYVQDEFRYLNVDLKMGGHIPAPVETIAKRGYGDCKDLSLLLSVLLTGLNIPAHPVLVKKSGGQSIPDFLPSDALFDHTIVAFELESESYWVDPTIKQQGGGATGRFTPDYAFGLPVKSEASALSPQPQSEEPPDEFEFYETLMVDTAGNDSIIRIQRNATGEHADIYRALLANDGETGLKESYKKELENRYGFEPRLEDFKYEDNRKKNRWRSVEVYRFTLLKNVSTASEFSDIRFPEGPVLKAIPIPEDKERKAPYAIPNRLNFKHTIEVRSNANMRKPPLRKRYEALGLQYLMHCSFSSQKWIQATELKTDTSCIEPSDMPEIRKFLELVSKQFHFIVTIPRGQVRPHRDHKFFELIQFKDPEKEAAVPRKLPPTQVISSSKKDQPSKSRRHSSQSQAGSSKKMKKKRGLSRLAFWKK